MHVRALLILAAIPLIHCVGPPPAVAPERAAALAGGLDHDVPFRTEQLAIDAESPVPERLLLSEAVQRALTESAEVQAALARSRRALAEAGQARLLPNPVLDVAFRLVEGGATPRIDVGLTAELAALLTRTRRADAADARLERAAHEVVARAIEVVAELRVDYAEVQALTRRARLLDERLAFFDRLLATARAKLDVGEGVRLDVLTLEAQRLELELESEGRRIELELARRRLLHRIGSPGAAPAFDVEEWSSPPPPPDAEEPWIAAALARRPDLLALRAELRAAEAEAAAAGLSVLDGGGAGVTAERDGDWSIGPSLSTPLPLLDTGAKRKESARARWIEARHVLAAAERGAVTEVRTAIEALRGARRRLGRVESELLPIEQQRRDQVEAVYLGGESDVTALLLAERDLRQAQERLVELQQSTVTAWARFEQAVGGAAVLRGGPEDETDGLAEEERR